MYNKQYLKPELAIIIAESDRISGKLYHAQKHIFSGKNVSLWQVIAELWKILNLAFHYFSRVFKTSSCRACTPKLLLLTSKFVTKAYIGIESLSCVEFRAILKKHIRFIVNDFSQIWRQSWILRIIKWWIPTNPFYLEINFHLWWIDFEIRNFWVFTFWHFSNLIVS